MKCEWRLHIFVHVIYIIYKTHMIRVTNTQVHRCYYQHDTYVDVSHQKSGQLWAPNISNVDSILHTLSHLAKHAPPFCNSCPTNTFHLWTVTASDRHLYTKPYPGQIWTLCAWHSSYWQGYMWSRQVQTGRDTLVIYGVMIKSPYCEHICTVIYMHHWFDCQKYSRGNLAWITFNLWE